MGQRIVSGHSGRRERETDCSRSRTDLGRGIALRCVVHESGLLLALLLARRKRLEIAEIDNG
jgi:hypothetical protein